MTPIQPFRIALLFVITFSVGLVAGYLTYPVVNQQEVRSERTRGDREGQFRNHVVTKLNLTPDQEVRFFETLDAHRRKTRVLMNSAREELDEAIRSEADSLKKDLSTFLTVEQVNEWQLLARHAMRGNRRP
jgi:Spy/CpxP family protein refolding chaperone